MPTANSLYFDHGGPRRTAATLRAVKAQIRKLQPEALVVTSSSGKTALAAARLFAVSGRRLIAVPFQKHLWSKYTPLHPRLGAQCRRLGVEFLPDQPVVPLLDEERPDVVNAWRTLGQGFKVALQAASMCVDTGLLKPGARVIAVGGSGRGADTAIMLRTRGYREVLRSRVLRVIAIATG